MKVFTRTRARLLGVFAIALSMIGAKAQKTSSPGLSPQRGAVRRGSSTAKGAAPQSFTTDFAFCYLFNTSPASGGKLSDNCGTNHATLATGIPPTLSSYYGGGWQWNNGAGATLPSSIGDIKTVYFTVGLPPSGPGGWNSNPGEPYLMGVTNLAVDGVAFRAIGGTPGQSYFGFTAQNLKAGGGMPYVGSSGLQGWSGIHVITWECGGLTNSTFDKFYIDGVPLKEGVSGGLRGCGLMAANNNQWIVGAEPPFRGTSIFTYFDLRGSANLHTDAQVQQNYLAIKAELRSRDIADRPVVPSRPGAPVLIFAGDSITCGLYAGGTPDCTSGTPWAPGTAAANTFTNKLALNKPFHIYNYGVPGAFLQQQVASAPVQYAPLCSNANGKSIAYLFAGTNNFYLIAPSFKQVKDLWELAVSWSNTMHVAGCRTGFIAMIARGDGTSTAKVKPPYSYDQWKNLFDAYAREHWVGTFDDFIDTEADQTLGCNGCANNPAQFTAGDKTHLTAAGELLLASLVSPHINWLADGSSPGAPKPAIVTVSVHSSTANDEVLIFDTSAGDVTDNLFSARTWVGRKISRCNHSTDGRNTLTIQAPADYPFNNIAGSTSVTVPNGTCKTFEARFTSQNAYAAVGSFWVVY